MKNRIRVEDENRVSIDDTNYDLTLEQAVMHLLSGLDIIAKPHADYSSDDLSDWNPEPEKLKAEDFRNDDSSRISDYLRMYQSYGSL